MVYRGRFALLWHEIPEVQDESQSANFVSSVGSHWDLLLELDNGELLTWQIASLPDLKRLTQSLEIPAKRLKNHRSIYLDYEGPISGNRGSVQRLASGTYAATFAPSSPPDGQGYLFPSYGNSEKVLEPLPLARIALAETSTMSSTEPAEQIVVQLASPQWHSPAWRLTLKTNIVAEGHCTLMTVSKRFS
jgi:hypothetical protein